MGHGTSRSIFLAAIVPALLAVPGAAAKGHEKELDAALDREATVFLSRFERVISEMEWEALANS